MSDEFTFGEDGSAAAKPAAKKPAAKKPAARAAAKPAPKPASKPAARPAAQEKPQQARPQQANPARPAPAASGQASADSATARDDMSRILGQIVSLLGQSPTHKHVFLADLEWMVLPALVLRQVRVWRRETDRGNLPVAYASWAMVTPDVDRRLSQGQKKLRPDEWNAGDIAWLIDLVAPYGGADTALQELANQVVPNGVIKVLTPNAGGGVSVRDVAGSGR